MHLQSQLLEAEPEIRVISTERVRAADPDAKPETAQKNKTNHCIKPQKLPTSQNSMTPRNAWNVSLTRIAAATPQELCNP